MFCVAIICQKKKIFCTANGFIIRISIKIHTEYVFFTYLTAGFEVLTFDAVKLKYYQ
ncbi:hypothetical protein CHRYSEO8AT_480073 [Chryseobacterium sp. 8AT]|nr:hypothetical protein CHRYSEO8AT_480073 [Chryseobacterium sp. 8AT]